MEDILLKNEKRKRFFKDVRDPERYDSIQILVKARKFNDAYLEMLKYKEEYPKDIFAKALYGKILYLVGLTDEAEEILLEEINSKNDEYAKDYLITLYMEQERYMDAYPIIVKLLDKDKNKQNFNIKLNLLKLLCEKNLGLELTVDKGLSYMADQIIEYSEEKTLDHMRKHFYGNPDEETVFAKGMNPRRLLKKVKKLITRIDLEPTYTGNVDEYYLHYTGIGSFQGETKSYIKVLTIHGTKDIVNMYPVGKEDAHDIHELDEQNYAIVDRAKENYEKIKQLKLITE